MWVASHLDGTGFDAAEVSWSRRGCVSGADESLCSWYPHSSLGRSTTPNQLLAVPSHGSIVLIRPTPTGELVSDVFCLHFELT